MSNFRPLPKLLGATALATASLVLSTLALPALAAGAEPPSLSISPAAFGNVTVGTESAPQEFDVVNEGGEDAMTESPYVEGPDEAEFKILDNGCAKLSPGEHCTIKVSFAPKETGEREATLVLPASNAPAVSTPLDGTSVEAILTFEPEPLEFGLVRVNQGISHTVGVLNSGEGRVHVDFLGIGGPDSGAFGNGGNSCSGVWLEPGQGCSAEVWFNPREMRGYEAFLEVHAGPQTFDLQLAGTGGNTVLEPESNPVELGTATVGSQGPVRAIELTNVGNMEGGYFIAVIAGGNAASFQLLDESCTGVPIAPNTTCVAHVRFTPQSAGPKSARLALFGDGEGGTMVELRGEGLAPAAAIGPPSFEFGSLAVGSRGAPQAFVVSNPGAGAVEIGPASIVGANADQFVLSGDECVDAVLASGQECTVWVRFAPDSVGAKTARLRVATGGEPLTAALAGLGAAPAPQGSASSTNATSPSKRHHRRVARFRRNATIYASRAIR